MTISARVSILDHRTMFGTTVRISAEPETPISDLLVELKSASPVDGDLFYNGVALSRFRSVGELDLSDGAVFAVGEPIPPLRDRDEHPGVDVLIAGGPDAGRVIQLSYGRHEIGRDSFRDIALNDPEVSRNHAQLEVNPVSVTLTDLGSANGTLVDGKAVVNSVQLTCGEYVRVGNTVLVVSEPEAADTALVRGHDGTLIYNRRFRSSPDHHETSVEFPNEFEEEPPPAISLLYLAVPMIAGILMALIMGPRFLIFAFLGPITGVAGMAASRRQHKARQERQREKHERAKAKALERLRVALLGELQNRRDAAPDLATLARAARGPRRKLWERRPTDDDFLDLRAGLANRPSTITLSGDDAPEPPILPDVPVTVSLVEAGSIGVAGDSALAVGIARSFLFQIATLHSPSDVRIVVISRDPTWSWTRWLPHARGDDDQLLIAGDQPSARKLLELLEGVVRARLGENAHRGGFVTSLPRFIVLLDHASRLERHRVAAILADGPSVGINAICIEDTEPELPEEYAGATIIPRDERLLIRLRNKPTVSDVSEEIIHPIHADVAARCLAPLRAESTSVADLPASCRLLDTISLPDPTPQAILDRWKLSEGKISAIVGVATSGELTIELDDRAPHGLVAGMSGAGKSEFLKTFLAGLAIGNHPDDLQFLLIDFKGGADYRTLARLPHTIDLVTNIDDPEHAAVKRAVSLLEAEIERRQRAVNKYGVRDLATYRVARTNNPSIPIMGRILVVVDEFAELATQRPELLDNLVSVARIGRAMGVHLLLATQRPSGAITGQIQANVPLRICFRVKHGEAADVINSDEPEQIATTLAGRGFVRNGDDPAIEFQCSRVGNARPSVAALVEPVTVSVESWSGIGHPSDAAIGKGPEAPDPDTDLWDVVESSILAAEAAGWDHNPVPWPRPLPESLRFSPNRAVVIMPDGTPGASIGLRDDPREQRHVPYSIGLGRGNMAIAGSPGTGKTTALRTIAAAFGYLAPPSDLHIHALDFGGGGLWALRSIPHVGTVTDDLGIASRLVDRLEEELDMRRATFRSYGWASLTEQWSSVGPTERAPAIVVLVDDWNSLVELSRSSRGETLTDRLARLISNGSSVGFQAMITGDRSVASGQISRQMSHRLVLRFNDPADYQSLDIGLKSVPSVHPDGRALIPTGRGQVDQVQISHVGKDATGATQKSALQTIGAHLSSGPANDSDQPLRLAALPMSARLSDILTSFEQPPAADGFSSVCVGVGGDSAEPIWFNLRDASPGVGVAGPPRSGRSSALVAMTKCVIGGGARVVIATNGDSPLEDFTNVPGVLANRRWSDLSVDETAEIVGGEPAVFVVDDSDKVEPRDELMSWIIGGAERGFRVLASGTTTAWSDSVIGWLASLRRSGHGLLLHPTSSYDGSAIGMKSAVPQELQFNRPAGRAIWVVNDLPLVVQVAV